MKIEDIAWRILVRSCPFKDDIRRTLGTVAAPM